MAAKRVLTSLLAASLAGPAWCASIVAPRVSIAPAGTAAAGALAPSVTLQTVPGLSAGLAPSAAVSLPGISTLRPEVHAAGLAPTLQLPASLPSAAHRIRAVREDGRRIVIPKSGEPLKALKEEKREGAGDIGGKLSGLFDGTGKTEEAGALALDAVDLGSDGSRVAPALSLSGADVPKNAVGRVRDEVIRMTPSLVDSVYRRIRSGRHLSLEDQVCRYSTEALGLMLRARGLDAHAVDAEFHNYLVVRTGHGDVYIDPSIRQFFEESAYGRVPMVFIGTWPELKALFASSAKAKKTKYEPERIYLSEAGIMDAIISQAREIALRVDGWMRGGIPAGRMLDAQEAEDLDAYAPIVGWLRRNAGEKARPAQEKRVIVPGSESSGRSGLILP